MHISQEGITQLGNYSKISARHFRLPLAQQSKLKSDGPVSQHLKLFGLIAMTVFFLVVGMHNSLQGKLKYAVRLPFNHSTTVWKNSQQILPETNQIQLRKVWEQKYKKVFKIQNAMTVKRPHGLFYNLLQEDPPAFEKNFRNPCWYGMPPVVNYSQPPPEIRLMCIPQIYIIGFPKCGTTALGWTLGQHPMLVRGDVKESHWWTRGRTRIAHVSLNRFYYYFFTNATEKILQNATNGYHPLVTFDASASTVWDQQNWRKLPENKGSPLEPNVSNAHYLHHFTPGVSLIIMVRDPAKRAFSDYKYFYRDYNKSPEDFHQGVLYSLEVWKSCLRHNTPRGCVHNETVQLAQQIWGRLYIGMYEIYLRDWFSVFPAKQILVLRMEDYERNRTQELIKVQDFIGYGSFTKEVLHAHVVRKRQSQNFTLQMLPETRLLLDDHYQQSKQDLAKLLLDEKYLWKTN